jgi:hypothetical protein
VIPALVVRDNDALVALYVAPGTRCKRRSGRRGGPTGRLLVEDSGEHEDWTWSENRRFFLWRQSEWYAVSLFWRDADDAFLGWYVDILEPLRRSHLGIDTRDLILDIVIPPIGAWRWKDEDELEWSGERGTLAPYGVESIRQMGQQTMASLQDGDPLLGEEWKDWRPDPTWPIPHLPDGWNAIGDE